MSDQLFEVAFFGKISEGANLDEVKARVGKIFKADEAKLAQLFSGKRIVIKKNIDRATAAKYEAALKGAGAVCEVTSLAGTEPAAQTSTAAPAATTDSVASAAPSTEYETAYDGDVEPPPRTDPLGISGDQIEDLAVSIAPVGSELQDAHDDPKTPQIDIAGLDIAPVGSDISPTKKDPDPPPPDVPGLTMAD